MDAEQEEITQSCIHMLADYYNYQQFLDTQCEVDGGSQIMEALNSNFCTSAMM